MTVKMPSHVAFPKRLVCFIISFQGNWELSKRRSMPWSSPSLRAVPHWVTLLVTASPCTHVAKNSRRPIQTSGSLSLQSLLFCSATSSLSTLPDPYSLSTGDCPALLGHSSLCSVNKTAELNLLCFSPFSSYTNWFCQLSENSYSVCLAKFLPASDGRLVQGWLLHQKKGKSF